MSSEVPASPVTPLPPSRSATLYATAGEGLKAVQEHYLDWTGRLTDSSLQLSLGVLAANWAVFGTVRGILGNPWAKSSVFLVIATMTLNLLCSKWMSELHRNRVNYASANVMRWEEACTASLGKSDPWPFTRGIERLGRAMREVRTWLPLAAGALFLTGLARS